MHFIGSSGSVVSQPRRRDTSQNWSSEEYDASFWRFDFHVLLLATVHIALHCATLKKIWVE